MKRNLARTITFTTPTCIQSDDVWTWAEEYVRIKKLGSSLYKAGVRPGR
jgi:hypothetical protein